MTGSISSNSTRLIFSLLILLGFSGTSLFSQTDTVINKYARVLSRSDYQVTVDDASAFSGGDYVLIIQMKGVSINAENNSGYGLLLDKVGKPGEYEFLIINLVIGNTITFLSKIKKYDPAGFVQIVRVPFFNSTRFNKILTCKEWDDNTGTGGVLAMIVGRTLTLNGNIDVSGKGFRGGKDTVGLGLCADANGIKDKYSFLDTAQNAGYKGEGISSHYSPYLGATPVPLPLLLKGQGQLFSGGGGGNGRFSGGGGGSNRGRGFNGGVEDITCGDVFPYLPISGGNGGFSVTLEKIDTISNTGGVFMGGGGGSSTSLEGSFATSGGNGGGIIFIIADTIKGNNKSIIASGDSAKTATNIFSGAGGGGAGGSIMIFSQSYSSDSLKIKINGAKGGDVYHLWATTEGGGPGGGGGGGYVALLKPISGKILIDSTGGGVSLIKYSGFDPDTLTNGGEVGKMRTGVVPVLTGFLFNSISSNVTGNQVDSVCSNMVPPKITGTKPIGGETPYTYKWEKSYDSTFVSSILLSNDADPTNYTPTLGDATTPTGTVWFMRTITDSSPTPIVDYSKPVKIIVQPAITGNLVGKDTTICYGQNPLSLVPLNTGPTNGSSFNYYKYKWIQNTTNTNWNTSPDAAGTNNSPSGSYDPPALTDTTYYQRVVTSGRCVNYSLTVTLTVLPLITGNITARPDSVICEGSQFNPLGASAAGGGNGIYEYQWQDSIVSSVKYLPAAVTNTGQTYSSDTSTFSVIEKRFFRRVVFSGPDSVCQSRSLPILLTRYHKIKNNSILADQTICSGTAPPALSGSTPSQGSGAYTYIWQDSSKVSTWATRGTTDFSFPPPALTDTTWYRRIVNSSKCTNTSLSIRIDVHKPILNNNISLSGGLTDTTICNGQVPHLLKGTVATGGTNIPGSYTYQWIFSIDNTNWNPVPVAGTGVNYQPPALTIPTYYKRQVISGACTVVSSTTIRVTVLQLITNNIISANQTVCYNTGPTILTGAALSGGAGVGTYSFFWEQSADGTTWIPAAGTNNLPSGSYQPPALTLPMEYKRTVKSGANDCCTSISNVIDITIHPPLPTGSITSTAAITICEGSKVPLDISLTGVSPWKVIYNENSTQVTVNNITAPVTTLLASPVTGITLTTFNYSLFSVEDKNGCFATSLTGTRKADVYKVPIANPGRDTVVCGPTYTLKATPSNGTGKWYEQSVLLGTTPSITVTVNSTFSGGNVAHTFTWEEINWQCSNKDSVIITFDKRVSSVNAGPVDTTIWSFDNIFHMVADPILAWETGKWSVVTGYGKFNDETNNLAKVTELKETNLFLWTVTNGTCNLKDSIIVYIKNIIIPQGFSPNGDDWNNKFIIKGLDLPNQIAELTVVNGAGSEVFSTTNRDVQEWTDWDGKNSKGLDLPEGTYYYLLKITSKGNGQVFRKSGFIILKRY